MPIYMDLHIIPGVKARDVAEAHRRDMLIQTDHACNCMTYWIDEKRGNVFCLIEAPAREAVEEMHRRAHGLVPNRIIEVNDAVVESFLGRISDPAEAIINDEGLKVFSDPSFRVLLVTRVKDPVLLQHQLGKERAAGLLQQKNQIIRKHIAQHGGTEAEHEGAGFVVVFNAANKAVTCAIAIREEIAALQELRNTGFRIGINAGEPVTGNEKLFGETIQLAERISSVARDLQVAVSTHVKELIARENFNEKGANLFSLAPQDESLLGLLFNKLEENWQHPGFDVEDYCQAMAMSKSQLYRKTIHLTGFSPNVLLKEFRLEKARELMRKQRYNIAGITFEAGFTSPSYFTKCFKKKFGLLPMAYIDALH